MENMPVQRDKILECRACHGHLVPDRYVDTEDEGGHMWIRLLRCVGCGRVSNIMPPQRTRRLQYSPFGNTTARNYRADESTPLGI
jgi:Pyruvate/2-oxoacid:ferredoxin oxidoreductase delta subunit